MERSLAEIRAKTAALPHPATLLVFERDPASLRNVYASGGYGFLHDMLEIAGGRNVFADVKQQAVQASTEMMLAEQARGDHRAALRRQPEERRYRARSCAPGTRWRRCRRSARTGSSRSTGDEFVVPGPRVVDATRKLARAIHPDAFK